MRSFNKLSADTVLCARNKNTLFVRHDGSFVKMSSSAVELQLAPSSYKSKVWKDFGFKVFYDGQGIRHFSLYSCVIFYHLLIVINGNARFPLWRAPAGIHGSCIHRC